VGWDQPGNSLLAASFDMGESYPSASARRVLRRHVRRMALVCAAEEANEGRHWRTRGQALISSRESKYRRPYDGA
ncbi:MAG: hypothetical protein ACO3P1_11675, partial [Pseudomonadales bacterium]